MELLAGSWSVKGLGTRLPPTSHGPNPSSVRCLNRIVDIKAGREIKYNRFNKELYLVYTIVSTTLTEPGLSSLLTGR